MLNQRPDALAELLCVGRKNHRAGQALGNGKAIALIDQQLIVLGQYALGPQDLAQFRNDWVRLPHKLTVRVEGRVGK